MAWLPFGRCFWPAANSPWASYPVLRRLGKVFVGLCVAGLVGVVVFGPNLVGMLSDRKIWFSTLALAAPPSDGLLDGYIGRWRERKNAPLILHEARDFKGDHSPTAAMLSSLRSAEAMTPLQPQLLAYTPRRLEFQVTAPADGWILVTDRWSRGWRASVNGTTAPIRPANFYFRAVSVKAGLNTVKMDYKPLVVPMALALSWGTLLGVVLLQFRKPRRRVGAVAP